MATALELLDFVPVFWILDAHALFHLATVPIPIWWADFLQQTYQPLLEKSENLKVAWTNLYLFLHVINFLRVFIPNSCDIIDLSPKMAITKFTCMFLISCAVL